MNSEYQVGRSELAERTRVGCCSYIWRDGWVVVLWPSAAAAGQYQIGKEAATTQTRQGK
jgi:hypothetical protein